MNSCAIWRLNSILWLRCFAMGSLSENPEGRSIPHPDLSTRRGALQTKEPDSSERFCPLHPFTYTSNVKGRHRMRSLLKVTLASLLIAGGAAAVQAQGAGGGGGGSGSSGSSTGGGAAQMPQGGTETSTPNASGSTGGTGTTGNTGPAKGPTNTVKPGETPSNNPPSK
jgi:hypothetical protein